MSAVMDVVDFENFGDGIGREERLIGTSENYLITTADNLWSLAVVIQPKTYQIHNQRELQGIRSKISHALKKHGYDVYKRTGRWTSERQARW